MRIWFHALGWLGASFGAQSPDVIQTPPPGSADGNASRHLASWPEVAFESRREVLTADDAVSRAADEQGWTSLFDLNGPGALVRVAAASSFAGWRVSVDGRELGAPLDLTAADLPFEERCKIESNDGVPAWCTVEWIEFSDGSAAAEIASSRRTLEAAQSVLPNPTRVIPFEIVLSPSEGRDSVRACSLEIPARASALETPRGAAIGALRFTLTPEGSRDSPRLTRFLRSTVISLSFDGRETIRLPFSELCNLGSNRDPGAGELEVRWWMPFRHAARLELSTLGSERVAVRGAIEVHACEWNERTMYLHGRWRNVAEDGHVLEIRGRGRLFAQSFEGSPLAETRLTMRTDEGAPVAWPLVAVGALEPGFAPERWTRWYGREAPLFSSAWRVGFAAPLAPGCSATTLYYALPSASDDTPALDASLHQSAANEAVASVHVPGALECERMVVSGATVGLEHAVQVLPPNETGRWSGGEHLFVRANAVGQFIELDVPVAVAGRREVVLHATRSWDYGTFQTFLDGALAGGPLSAFHAEMQTRIGAPRPVSLGVFDLAPPSAKLRVEVVGTDPRSRPPHYYLGLDCVVLKEPQR